MLNLTENQKANSTKNENGFSLRNLTNWKGSSKELHSVPLLENLAKVLNRKLNQSLKQLGKTNALFSEIQGTQRAISNLCNSRINIENVLEKRELVTEEIAILLLDDEISKTETLLLTDAVSRSKRGFEIAVFTYNQLFIAKQKIKSILTITTPLRKLEDTNSEAQPTNPSPKMLPNKTEAIQTIIVHASVLRKLHSSLFPAERMIVIAGIRKNNTINIGRIYDVTGVASSGHVRADANLLGRALIEMEESETYFAFWVHSHPGTGSGATHPSTTDVNQERDWLRDFSPELLNAIIVKDGFIRFWGKSIEEERVVVEVVGHGIKEVEANIYKLES